MDVASESGEIRHRQKRTSSRSRRRTTSTTTRRQQQQQQQRPSNANTTSSPSHQVSVVLSIPQHVREKLSRQWIVRVSTKALLLHTLYARGVCPAPASETLRVLQQQQQQQQQDGNGRSSKRLNPTQRKFVKFGRSLQRLLDEWSLLCSFVHAHAAHPHCGPHGRVVLDRVLITLGPSWSRQRERYILDFSSLATMATTQESTVTQEEEPGVGHEHALSRRLIRALLDAITLDEQANCSTTDYSNQRIDSLAHPTPKGSSYLVHLSVWISHSMADALFQAKSVNHSMILRPGYSTSSRNTRHTQPHLVTAQITSSDVPNDFEQHWVEDDGVWLSLPTFLKGFRL